MDIRVNRGANVDSDHFLPMARLGARLSNTRSMYNKKMRKLKSGEVQERFQQKIELNLANTGYGKDRWNHWLKLFHTIFE